jgi:4-hydroxyacetophenone monooxygenase
MTFNMPIRPIDVPDDVLRRHLEAAEVPVLLMTVAHLTGDLSVLRAGDHGPGWLFRPQGGLPPERRAEVRSLALDVLRRHRDAGSPAVPLPSPDVVHAVTTWAMGSDSGDLVPLITEDMAGPVTDPKAPAWTRDGIAPGRDLRVTIVGAGMSGLLAAHRLAQAGVPFVVYEKNRDVGGTWFENRYPGCRTDVPSYLYNYSFATRSDWPEHFTTWEVMLDYFRTFAKEHGLHEHIRFGAEVRVAEWDGDRACWRLQVETPDGTEERESEILISAVGQLNRPHVPDIPGRDTFAGPAFHSARWDPTVEMRGKRVAVVGTGASAFQIVPEVAEVAGELLVVQRTPPWLRPTPHYHDPVPESVHWLHEHVPSYGAWHRFWLFAPGLRGVLEGWVVDPDHPPTERAVSALNEQLRATIAEAMEAQLTDAPELRPLVMPQYPVGAKRVLRDNGVWLATLKRADVRLVPGAVTGMTPRGLRTDDGEEHPVDVVVFATGFEAAGFLVPMRIRGRDGIDLHETWAGDARAYLGLTLPGFPNLFCLYGPNTNLAGQGGSIFTFSECGVGYVLDALRVLLAGQHRSLEVRRDVHDRYNAWVDAGNAQRAWGWSNVNTWHFDRRAGRSVTNWPYSALEYWRRTRRLDPDDYLIH